LAIALTGLALGSGAGAQETAAHKATAGLQGRVVAHGSGAPLPDASVSVLGTDRETRTDADGFFMVEGLLPGLHTVVISCPGMVSRTDTVTISSHETVGVEVQLGPEDAGRPPGLVVTGRLRLGNGTEEDGGPPPNVYGQEVIGPLLAQAQSAWEVLWALQAPGLRVRKVAVLDPVTGVPMHALCVEVGRRDRGDDCRAASVVVNGVHVPDPDRILRSLAADIIDRVEILSPSEARASLGVLGRDGAVVIYTR
jgi:hypothetical protein